MICVVPYLPASTSYAVAGCYKIALVVRVVLLGHQDLGHFPFPLDLQPVHPGHLDLVPFPLDLQDLVVHPEVQDQADHLEVQDQVLSNVIYCMGLAPFFTPKERGDNKQGM